MSTSDFFSSVSTFATPVLSKVRRRDPIAAARAKFNTAAALQIKLIQDAKLRGFWFQREGAAVVVTLKNGSAILNPAKPRFALSSQGDAIQFLEKAQAAAIAGEFDALFSATARKAIKGAAGASPSGGANATPASAGQLTWTAVEPRRSSMRVAGAVLAAGSCVGTRAAAAELDAALEVTNGWDFSATPPISASRTQRRSRFALMPWASATAAIDMPGGMHEATKLALKSSL